MEQLPTNILVKIFDHLGKRDLIVLSCTCRRFLEVTTDFMALSYPPIRIDFDQLYYNKIQKFSYKDGKDFNVLIETPRNYQNYIFMNFNKEHTDRLGNKWLQLFKRQMNARTIRIKSDCMDPLQLIKLLKMTHRLIYLEIDGYRLAKIMEPIEDSDIVAKLPSLKHLKIHSFLDATPTLFKIFHDCTTLKTLSLSAIFMVSKQVKSINDLIFNQRALEQLELIGLDTHNGLFQCDQMHQDATAYKLIKINVEYNGFSLNLEKFHEYFIKQKCLKEVKLSLDLRNSMHYAQELKLCEGMIHHCLTQDSLTSLNLLINKFTKKDLSTNPTEFIRNKSIKRLTFENESRDSNVLLVAMLKALPSLRFLELACDYNDELLEQLSHMTKVKHLKLIDYSEGLLKRIKCSKSLESIAVKYCYTRNSGPDWSQFLNTHPNIKKIYIDHSIEFMDDAIIEVIAGACGDKLESFIMSDSVAKNVSENAHRSFQRHCPNLKYLKLTDRPSKRTQNKHQSFHDMLANIKCVISFYVICIIFFIVLIFLMVFEKI